MLGTAGILIPTALGLPQWYEAGEKALACADLTLKALLFSVFTPLTSQQG
jgi:hypothetical protein